MPLLEKGASRLSQFPRPICSISKQPLLRLRPIKAKRAFLPSCPRSRAFSVFSPPRLDAEKEGTPRSQENVGMKRLADFDLAGGVYLVSGGARGLGLTMAEGLVEAGGKVYCLDIADKPDEEFEEAKGRILPEFGGSLDYRKVDVRDTENLNQVICAIGKEHGRMDGLIAAAGVQQVLPATEYTVDDAMNMMAINYTGVFMTATAVARQMIKYKCRGSICLIASMSGIVANKGLLSPVYNSSKAAVIQLARNLSMEWGRIQPEGTGGIRVNALSPGHIITPMVLDNFKQMPGLREKWESENQLGRLASPEEFKSAGLFLLSRASSFMTGTNLVIDGGHTAW
ncbi:short-chain dehydrogenase [Aulographum hederae CBS 113979]|uniref:Short-chain dehydrogenase n=1 Tax=Aulographum hederae CBS 113979 TaxID=1176131 RepID=A0A6G1GZT5_9PEZI|nr:short-chain dehydrogenase [Aulographum hederae CBS 113979]